MNRKLLNISLSLLLVGTLTAEEKYQPDWESLRKHEPIPEWFRDAKLGIYFHWGVYSVPEFGNEWYPKWMHDKNHAIHKHHVATYGEPDKYGYHEFVPKFTAEHFDAEDWAQLFKDSGAKFAGPVAEHHDGFSMFKTKYSPWNVVEKGPKRDITGQLAEALRKRDIKLITTFHHGRHWNGVTEDLGNRRNHFGLVKRDYPSLLKDDELKLLYGEFSKEFFHDMWKGKLVEVIDQYSPDLIWFDSELDFLSFDRGAGGGEKVVKEFLAYYFNEAAKNDQEVAVVFKDNDLPDGIGIVDFERGGAGNILEPAWLTDDCIARGSWSYTKNPRYYEAKEVFHAFLDRVSKNGQLLLNILPRYDGTIPQEQRDILLAFGDWLGTFGEAVYATRNWDVYGEGPTKMGGGHFTLPKACTAEDVRYTRSKDQKTLYAIMMDWPEGGGERRLKMLGAHHMDLAHLDRVELLTKAEPIALKYRQETDALIVQLPSEQPDTALAYPVRLTFSKPMRPMQNKPDPTEADEAGKEEDHDGFGKQPSKP